MCNLFAKGKRKPLGNWTIVASESWSVCFLYFEGWSTKGQFWWLKPILDIFARPSHLGSMLEGSWIKSGRGRRKATQGGRFLCCIFRVKIPSSWRKRRHWWESGFATAVEGKEASSLPTLPGWFFPHYYLECTENMEWPIKRLSTAPASQQEMNTDSRGGESGHPPHQLLILIAGRHF